MGQPIKIAEVYNFDTKTWTTLPEMPTPRAACTRAVVRGDKIILVGGVTTKQLPVKAVDCFDTAANKWVEFPPLPLGVVGPYVQLIDDKIYCIGGTDKKGCNQSVVYDFDDRRWLPLPKKPSPCYSCGGYLYDRKLIIVGGRNGPDPVQAVEAFDLDTKQWERLAPMNAIRVFYGVIGIQDEIYVVGGLVPQVGVTKVVERYSIHEDMWCRIRDLNSLRSDAAYGVVGNRVVIVGGIGGGGDKPAPMDTGECIEYRGRRFKKLPQLSLPRTSVSTVRFEGKMAVINGVSQGPTAVVEILKVKEKDKDKNL